MSEKMHIKILISEKEFEHYNSRKLGCVSELESYAERVVGFISDAVNAEDSRMWGGIWIEDVDTVEALQRQLKEAERMNKSYHKTLSEWRSQQPPCSATCYHHQTHPCENCGLINGYPPKIWQESKLEAERESLYTHDEVKQLTTKLEADLKEAEEKIKRLDRWHDYFSWEREFKIVEDENKRLKKEISERKLQLEAAFKILEEYTPTEKLDEANDKMILLCKGVKEEMGRDLLKKKPLKPK